MKKRILVISMILVMMLSFLACSNKNNTTEKQDKEQNEEQTYEYSEYVERERLEKELIESFNEYNIKFYDNEHVKFFGTMDLARPETAITGFPTYSQDDDSYVYVFTEEKEARVYTSAYMVYLMSHDYELEELDRGVYVIDDKYYMGVCTVENGYALLIMEP